jgi:putative Mg2+ transporter-C (MgtC) family protein
MEVSKVLLFKLLLAMIIGGVIGIERELRSKSAGFRTIILICLGATLFTIFSQVLGEHSSPDRIASNVVVGIGFLGAGVIFRSENNNRVNGITTAASIWLSAALGVGIGCGYYAASIVGCFLVLATLFLFSFFDRVLERVNQLRIYKITFPYQENQQHRYEEMIQQYGLRIKSRTQTKAGNIVSGMWTVTGSEKKHHAFIDQILREKSITEFSF